MKPGDLVREAKVYKHNGLGEATPDFSQGTVLGIVLSVRKDYVTVLVDGHPTYIVPRNLEIVDEAR